MGLDSVSVLCRNLQSYRTMAFHLQREVNMPIEKDGDEGVWNSLRASGVGRQAQCVPELGTEAASPLRNQHSDLLLGLVLDISLSPCTKGRGA